MSPRLSFIFLTLCLSIALVFSNTVSAQDTSTVVGQDSTFESEPDSNDAGNSKLIGEIPISKNALKEEIQCSAKDSIVYDIENKMVLLYGAAVIDYGDLHLEADIVFYDWEKNLMKAYGTKDTAGNEIGYPKIVDKGREFRGDSMIYNITSSKGKIYNLKMQEGNGYVHVAEAKKLENDVMYAKDAKYSTCDADEPHFWMHMSKAKIIPNDKVITGPAYLMVENVPIYAAVIPFGFFPTNIDKASSGIIFPRYGFTPLKGYNLSEGGYYFAISDMFDLSLTGDIYSFGYWGVNVKPRYRVRYKYSGSAEFNLDKNPSSFENAGEVTPIYDFRLKWSHRQDPKSIPGMTFSANVNAGTATYGPNSAFDTETRLNQNLMSSVNFSKKLGKNFNFSTSLNHNQNLSTRSISFSLPIAALTMQRQTPFDKLRSTKLEILKNLNFSQSINFNNRITTYDSMIFDPQYANQWNTGLKHSLPVNTSFKILKKKLNVNPSFTYNGYVNFYETELGVDTANEVIDVRNAGTYYAFDYQFNTSINTRLYGTYGFKRSEKLVALRHVITPAIRLNYTPDFTQDKFGYYREYEHQVDDSTTKIIEYNRFKNNPLGAPIDGKSGSVGFSLANMLELKVRDKKDTVNLNATKKIKILESLNADMNYNFFADSLNLSDLNLSARTILFKTLNLRSTARFNPYQRDENFTKINTLLWTATDGQKMAKLESFNFNASVNITEKMFKQFSKKTNERAGITTRPDSRYNAKNLPVSMTIGYDYTLRIKTDKLVATQSLKLNGRISMTKRWGINYDLNYDLEELQLGYSKFSIRRDLHCWEYSFDWTPTGQSQGFYFTLRAKASELESLKLEKNQYFWD